MQQVPLPGYRAEIWQAWDRQEDARRAAVATRYYIQLSNLYLTIQAGDLRLTRKLANLLRTLPAFAYERNDPMIAWWEEEFTRLPHWSQF